MTVTSDPRIRGLNLEQAYVVPYGPARQLASWRAGRVACQPVSRQASLPASQPAGQPARRPASQLARQLGGQRSDARIAGATKLARHLCIVATSLQR